MSDDEIAERVAAAKAADRAEQALVKVAAEVEPMPVTPPDVPKAAAPLVKPKGGKRRPRPTIDIDSAIQDCKQKLKDAQKKVAAARLHQRNEKRRKQRVVKKAASLSLDDLERIAVLKRCGLVTEKVEDTAACVSPGTAGSSTSAASTADPTAPFET